VLFRNLTEMPPVLHEESLKCFKFLFNGELYDGVHHNNELFCRLYTVNAGKRAELYQKAFQLSRYGTVIITVGPDTYSLWISLRSPKAELYITKQLIGTGSDQDSPFQDSWSCL